MFIALPYSRRSARLSTIASCLIAGVILLAAPGIADEPQSEPKASDPVRYRYEVPETVDDGWPTVRLDEAGLNETRLSKLVDDIRSGVLPEVHAVLLARGGRLAFEVYFEGHDLRSPKRRFERGSLHYLASVTKSFTSAAVGLAIDKKILPGLDRTLMSFYEDEENIEWTEGKDRITLEHLITMRGGLRWDEMSHPYTDPKNSHTALNRSGDPIHFALSLPLQHPPGERFVYNSALPILLGDILRKASGRSLPDFTKEHLFKPLAIKTSYWWCYPDGTCHAGGGLYLTPRDMAKFGQLYLDGGLWKGQRILSEEWVEASIRPREKGPLYPTRDYGYLWWLETFEVEGRKHASYSARGWGGQGIYVFPELKLVAVFTGGNYGKMRGTVKRILTQAILPAVENSDR